MPAPPPESLPAIVSAVRMLITSARLCRIIAPPPPRLPVARRVGRRARRIAAGRATACAPAPCCSPPRPDRRGRAVRASRVPWTAVPFTMQPVAVLLAGAVLGARLGALSQVLYLALGVTGASMFALSPVLAPGAGPAARADRRLPAGVSAGGVRRRMARRPRLDAHLRRRGWRRCWPGWRCSTPAARRGWRCWPARRASVTLCGVCGRRPGQGRAGGGGAAGRGARVRRRRADRRPRPRSSSRRRGRRSGSTETAGTSRPRSSRRPARVASPSIVSAATRSARVGSRPRIARPEVHDAEPSARLERRARLRKSVTRSSISWTTPTTQHAVERDARRQVRIAAPAEHRPDVAPVPRAAPGG